jgi:hypothetical protein
MALIMLLLVINGHDHQQVKVAVTLEEEADPMFEAFPISLVIPSEDEVRSKAFVVLVYHEKCLEMVS